MKSFLIDLQCTYCPTVGSADSPQKLCPSCDKVLYAMYDIDQAKQSFSKSQMESLKEKYSNLIEKNSGEIIKIEDWGLINMAYQIDNNKKGNYIHIKLKGDGKTINELEKKERIDSNLLRFLTVRVKKFDLENDKLVLKNKD